MYPNFNIGIAVPKKRSFFIWRYDAHCVRIGGAARQETLAAQRTPIKVRFSRVHYREHIMKIELFYSICRFLRVLYQRFFDDGCMSRAASLTYTTLLSIVRC